MSDLPPLPTLLAVAALGAAVGSLLTWAWLRGRAHFTADPTAPRAEPTAPVPPAATAVPRSAVMPSPGAADRLPPLAADVLVVDDSAVARAKLKRLLESQGYSVHLANDGVDALGRLEKGRYALMISDLEMPNMDGVTLIRHCQARAETARMPILAISGHEDLRARFNACHDIGGVHRKPWVDDVLTSHFATLVGARPPRRMGVGRDARAPALA
jgi:CheY-like chemotaxis protein